MTKHDEHDLTLSAPGNTWGGTEDLRHYELLSNVDSDVAVAKRYLQNMARQIGIAATPLLGLVREYQKTVPLEDALLQQEAGAEAEAETALRFAEEDWDRTYNALVAYYAPVMAEVVKYLALLDTPLTTHDVQFGNLQISTTVSEEPSGYYPPDRRYYMYYTDSRTTFTDITTKCGVELFARQLYSKGEHYGGGHVPNTNTDN